MLMPGQLIEFRNKPTLVNLNDSKRISGVGRAFIISIHLHPKIQKMYTVKVLLSLGIFERSDYVNGMDYFYKVIH